MDTFSELARRQIYESSGLDPLRHVSMPELARALLGKDCLKCVKPQPGIGGHSALTNVDGRFVIQVPCGLTAKQVNDVLARQLAEHYLAQHNFEPSMRQALAPRIASALLCPYKSMLSRKHGRMRKPANYASNKGKSSAQF